MSPRPSDETLPRCDCGCGGFLPVNRGGNGQQRYLENHRQRAYRQRLADRMVAVGLPPRLNLRAARALDPTSSRNGDAHSSRSGLQVSFRKAVDTLAIALYGEPPDAHTRARVEEMLRPALSVRQRERLDARP